MFDIILLVTKCPYCKKTAQRGIQTKNLEKLLSTYIKGATIPETLIEKFKRNKTKEKWIEGNASCHSEQCSLEAKKRDLIIQNIISGFGMLWHVRIKINDEYKITDEVEIIELGERAPDDWERKLKDVEKWEQIKKQGAMENKSLLEMIEQYNIRAWSKLN